MPNRYIREAAIESEAVNSLSWQAEVFWRRLLNKVDDFGRFTANLALLRASVFPLQLSRVRDSDIPRLLAECEKSGLLYVYSAGSKQFLVMNKWEKGRAKDSKYPPPPEDICSRMQTYVYTCEQAQTDVPDSDTDSDTDNKNPLTPLQGDGSRSKLPVKGQLQLRAEKLFRRRPETPLTVAEKRAFQKNRPAIEATTEEQWQALERFYAAPQSETYARKALAQLLNNWNGEIDLAIAWKGSRAIPAPRPVEIPPPNWQERLKALYPDARVDLRWAELPENIKNQIRNAA